MRELLYKVLGFIGACIVLPLTILGLFWVSNALGLDRMATATAVLVSAMFLQAGLLWLLLGSEINRITVALERPRR